MMAVIIMARRFGRFCDGVFFISLLARRVLAVTVMRWP
jgi:hypothetical protein